MPESPSDQQLITGCLEGKKESWDIFVERFSKLIYWSIWRTLENTSFGEKGDLAREIFQEVFEKLLERNELEKLREIEGIRKFLIVMACRLTLDKIKALGRHERKVEIAGEFNMLDTSLQVVSHERGLLIAEALKGLSSKERRCIEWHYVDGKTHRQIAKVLGLPQDTVSSVIRRTKERLRKIFLEKGILE